MTKYILHYFDVRARVEIIRLIFAISNIFYIDDRLKLEDWPAVKPTTLLGTLPYLEINDTFVLPQSQAIVRYLAREANLYGQNNLEAAQVDAFLETYVDGVNEFFDSLRLSIPDVKKTEVAIRNFFQGNSRKHFQNFEKLIQLWSVKNGYAVGNNVTVADVAIFYFGTYNPIGQSIAENFPGINGIIRNIEQNPRIAAYVESRPQAPW